MKLNARHLILDVMLASDAHVLSAREAILACRTFDISENSVRVALVRLSAEGLIEGAGRGSYRLATAARDLAGDIATWRQAEQRLRPWQKDWLVVFSAGLGRSDRTALNRRERALQMLGFRELDKGLHVRPNNIEKDVDAVRKRLHSLGLESDASVFSANDWAPAREKEMLKLWDIEALTRQYESVQIQLRAWMARASDLDPEVAARECFLLGGQAIRHVIFDPLLPDPLVNAKDRQAFVQTVREFDQLGHSIWRKLYDINE
ncbi:MAG: PaaX family transcriptional regulator [Paraperlucidibaca sp.]|jgi:phenylacetic acid degradation operon negative regulatory protein|uniref:PaaX family transcriptional regulator C-terminal domain-containing protein n=1 Tax=Paraperlucidibaca sp. TaxID=2708021 RepID=UPI001B6B7093|nr:PaaX family transcriptional regulator [Paraperlucidibaca sp.]MBQ0723434.1 PaaX family transcriptional regulator [Paraperlucidibaca sp.]MBQ0842204.1 PaaX family transcriptional regulator [Paraperlucidibaca sp.]|tara:strand:+ start:781 stop:1566 length:786 start_codon:yes stop_codon:yes gene_type:complete